MPVLEILENHPLKPFTTFKIGGPARYFAVVNHRQQIPQAIEFAASHHLPIFVLGGGSNLLISDEGIDAVVLHPVNEGFSLLKKPNGNILIRVEAGEPWDRVVATAVENDWWGIENLSHIPGQAGAAVVQNIGAYGQQLSSVLESVEVAELSTGNNRILCKKECGLGYRKSIFNTSHTGQFLVLSLTIHLTLDAQPYLTYPDVRAWFQNLNIQKPSIGQVREAIIKIRDRKFPYPRVEKGGNAGSFFKNLTLNKEEYAALERRILDNFGPAQRDRLRELRNRFTASDGIRVPTAFLMEICGLKGLWVGGAGVNATQPLVLLNQGGATARDILMLAQQIRQILYAKTGVKAPIEPQLAGFSPEELKKYLAFE